LVSNLAFFVNIKRLPWFVGQKWWWKRQAMVFLPVTGIFLFLYFLPFKLILVESKSLDIHVAIYEPGRTDVNLGDIVVFRWVGHDPQNKGLKDGMILVKKVGCMPGQKLDVTRLQYFCDGKAGSMLMQKDSRGNPVQPFLYHGEIPDGKFFMVGTHPMSYDSKYWGFADKSQIIGKVVWGV
jgi:signal peptidase I